MRRRHSHVLGLGPLFALLLCACGGEVTEIVVVVDTDIAAASRFRVGARFPGGGTATSEADLSVQAAPRRLVLLHEGGELGPVALDVTALDGASELTTVRREVTFEAGASLTLRVFLADACRTIACAATETCSNEGSCREGMVRPCEYDGRSCDEDAGPPDGGPPPEDSGVDGGTDAAVGMCSSTEVCGVADAHLPGDLVTPVLCSDPTMTGSTEIVAPSGISVPGAGIPAAFVLGDMGSYTARIKHASLDCFHERTIRVDPATAIVDSTPVSADELRDIAARVGTAFVAGRRGAYAVDTTGWFDLRAGGVATGDVANEDERAVVVVDDDAYFGPDTDVDAIYRVEARAPFTTATHTSIDIGGGDRRVRAMSTRVGGVEPIAVATVDGIMTVADAGTVPSVAQLGADYDADIWVANGVLELPSLGAVWGGRSNEMVNRATGAGGELNGGGAFSPPSFLGDLTAGAVDDRGASQPNLWLCGENSVVRFDFADMDWTSLSALPADTARSSGGCFDLAIDVGGDVWVAGGAAGLSRLASDATVRVVVEPGRGLPTGTSVDFVAVANDTAAREVWILDATNRQVLRLAADALP